DSKTATGLPRQRLATREETTRSEIQFCRSSVLGMTTMDKAEMTKRLDLVTALAEQFGRKNSEAGLVMFVNATLDVPVADLERAVMQAARESKFMPSPSEIRELAGIQFAKIEASDRAIVAFAHVKKAVAEHGGYATVQFGCP